MPTKYQHLSGTLNTQLSILVQGSIAMVTRDISCFSYRIYLYFQCYYNHWCLDCRSCVLNSMITAYSYHRYCYTSCNYLWYVRME